MTRRGPAREVLPVALIPDLRAVAGHDTLGARRIGAFVFARSFVLTAVGLLAACGSSSSPVAPTPTPSGPPSPAPPAETSTITISATGVSPSELTVPVGARVTFVNGDRIAHDVLSGIDHNSRDCPEVDVVGFLLPGHSRETSTFEQAKTCRFHDHANLGNANYQGRIVIR